MLKRLAREKHSSLLEPFASYKENKSFVNMVQDEYLKKYDFDFHLLKKISDKNDDLKKREKCQNDLRR